VLDDHEITDGWGDEKDHHTVGPLTEPQTRSPQEFVAACGWQVYNEYQASLFEHIENPRTGKHPAYIFSIHGTGVIMLETRASKSWFRSPDDDESSFLGKEQRQRVFDALREDGSLDSMHSLLVCSPVPLAFLSPQMTKTMRHGVADFYGLWGAFEHELQAFLEALRHWKLRDTNRELVVAAGDVHVGIQSDIFFGEELLCSQITSSAINNEPVGAAPLKFLRTASSGEVTLCRSASDTYTFRHNYMTARNNFAVVEVSLRSDTRLKGLQGELLEDDLEANSNPRLSYYSVVGTGRLGQCEEVYQWRARQAHLARACCGGSRQSGKVGTPSNACARACSGDSGSWVPKKAGDYWEVIRRMFGRKPDVYKASNNSEECTPRVHVRHVAE